MGSSDINFVQQVHLVTTNLFPPFPLQRRQNQKGGDIATSHRIDSVAQL